MDEEYKEYTIDIGLYMCNESAKQLDSTVTEYSAPQEGPIFTYHATTIVGDRFYKGDFMSSEALQKSVADWGGTLHDINHMGTTRVTALGALGGDIRYFVGWQDNISYNAETKSLEMDIHIDTDTMYGKATKAYIDLCTKAGKIPNVSISFLGATKPTKVNTLPVDYKSYGLTGEEVVNMIHTIKPRALSTVLEGACSDKQGCGISIRQSKKFENEKQKLIDELKKLDKEEK
jgi:hypothetical protein